MAVEAYLPTLTTIVITAAIDAINPCAIGVLILMISVLVSAKASSRRMFFLGSLYILTILVIYLLAGLGMLYTFARLPLYITEYLSITVGLFIVLAGILEIKDYFWYQRWFSLEIPAPLAKKLHLYSSNATCAGVIFLGAFVAAVELPCTGGPYLAVITLLSQYFDFTAFLFLLLYNVIFVLPLFIILLLVCGGWKIHEIKEWKQRARPYMRFFIGLLLIVLGWLLILIANGTINLG